MVLQWRKQQREKTPKREHVYKTLNDILKDQTTKFHNKNSIIESCEESMIRSHRRRKFDEDTKVALEHDSSYLQKNDLR
ncbi:unnamed protein product [Rotaria socialis]|uniref:Uncharacterized protein n=1 Tax=Rotaria socialis TaxID=392032 RepID=A0A817ZGN1_9BILA|nr:unnamed protein product [Rotaria socialis]CAF3390927.1 unnamed protein product [Rotaria socialis]